ncbi:MAG TPA: hypothetical protein VGH28_13785 [Polyangiaceae bacterium]|jgi:hypothetical protein
MAHHSKVWPTPPTDGVDSLTAAEAIALDNGQFGAIDGDTGGTWAPSAVIEIGGAGLQLDKALENVRALGNGTYVLDASGPDLILLCTASSGNCSIDLPAASASLNRVVKIKAQSVSGGDILIVPNGTDTIEGLNADYTLTTSGSFITLVGITGGWAIIGRGENIASKTFTASQSNAFLVPAGCHYVELDMWGGGAGGSGGAAGSSGASAASGGGPGGGAAKRKRVRAAVTPGSFYDVNIGAGGAGGAAGATGNLGGTTSFQLHGGAIVEQAIGGGSGTLPATVSTGGTLAPGGTDNSAPAAQGTSWANTPIMGVAGQGGFGGNAITNALSTAGGSSAEGKTGGAAGLNAGFVSTSLGGGGGGGGGAGPGGNGGTGGNGGAGSASAGAAGSGGFNPAGTQSTAAATTNTGAGGGGGGGGGCGTSGGAGGAGGGGDSGKLTIYWIE